MKLLSSKSWAVLAGLTQAIKIIYEHSYITPPPYSCCHIYADVAGFLLQIPQEEKISQSFMEQVATGILLWAEKLLWTRSYCQCSTCNLLHWFDTIGWAVNPREQRLNSCLSWKIKITAFLMISGSPVLVTDSLFSPSSCSTKKSKTTLLSRFGTLLPSISRSKYYTSFELQAFNADTVLVPVNHCLEVAGLPIYLWNHYQMVSNPLNRSWVHVLLNRPTMRTLVRYWMHKLTSGAQVPFL